MRASTAEAGYTVSEMADEQSTEIFDDLYLGLRAGGALRKQRRGGPLTAEEQEALGRWQRLSAGGKGIAIGGLPPRAVGAGVTPRRPVFRPWRRATAARSRSHAGSARGLSRSRRSPAASTAIQRSARPRSRSARSAATASSSSGSSSSARTSTTPSRGPLPADSGRRRAAAR